MNFLAHLYLADGDDDLMLGALLGDFIRGRRALRTYAPGIRQGVALHRYIDKVTDHSREIKNLRRSFPREFRRYAGIVIDLAFDHELARHWTRFSGTSLEQFDVEVRTLLSRNEIMLPAGLVRFMRYADTRGLFATYRDESEMLFSLAGIGTRLKRANPLHRVGEIWPEVQPGIVSGFERFFPVLQSAVAGWRKRKSTSTGS
jgi:acyl carrier protein phosphodiesterase